MAQKSQIKTFSNRSPTSYTMNPLLWLIVLAALGVIIYLLVRQPSPKIEIVREESNRDDSPPVIITPTLPVPVPIPPYPRYPPRYPHRYHDIPNPPYHK